MKELRWWIAALVAWLFALYNLERIHEPINIASFVYAFTAAVAIALLLFEGLCRRPWFWVAGLLLAAFFAVKVWLGYRIAGAHLPLTITEIVAIGMTLVLARQIVVTVQHFQKATSDTLLMHLSDRAALFEENGQEDLYREVRRARRFDRPLALVTLAPGSVSLNGSANRFMEEFQRDLLQKYINGRIADLLSRQVRDCDLIAQSNSHFILLLPETSRESAEEIVRRMAAAAEEELGLKMQIGLATFPDQEITFAGLLERAEAEMRSQQFQLVGQN